MTDGRREAKDAIVALLIDAQASSRVTGRLLMDALRRANGTAWHDLLAVEVKQQGLNSERLSALESRMMPEVR